MKNKTNSSNKTQNKQNNETNDKMNGKTSDKGGCGCKKSSNTKNCG